MRIEKSFLAAMVLAGVIAAVPACGQEVRDLRFFLHRLRTLDHLPELESAHTAMSSTWDRAGGNNDGLDFKQIEGTRNILLDVDGPGCIHRIFTGRLYKAVAGTRIQILLDGAERPICDLPVNEFFDDHSGPIPYPLVFHKTYPGMLFPIPFERHCRVQLVNEESKHWGNYWQVTYTRYAPGTKVRSLTWPLSDDERAELEAVCSTWLRAEQHAPAAPARWNVSRDIELPAGKTDSVKLDGCGVIRQIRVQAEPFTQEALHTIRVQARWDGEQEAAVDAPLGDLFGAGAAARSPDARINSLLMGANGNRAYCCFPMPFAAGAELRFENTGESAFKLQLHVDVQPMKELPPNWGRFHVTWNRHPAGSADSPRFGAQNTPTHRVIEQTGRGKYVGVLLQVDWPWHPWWGEGDWLIWSDEDAWPPSYHGTGSEEYFNAGWCEFDRKAVSGYITEHPGWAAVYTFHLNDAFQFQKNIRVVEETMGYGDTAPLINEKHAMWMSTAYWYAAGASAK